MRARLASVRQAPSSHVSGQGVGAELQHPAHTLAAGRDAQGRAATRGGRDTGSGRLVTGTISPGLSKTVLLRWNLDIVTFFHLERTITFSKCTELRNRHRSSFKQLLLPQGPSRPRCFRAGQAVCFPSRSGFCALPTDRRRQHAASGVLLLGHPGFGVRPCCGRCFIVQ